jgi:hypothetical protein
MASPAAVADISAALRAPFLVVDVGDTTPGAGETDGSGISTESPAGARSGDLAHRAQAAAGIVAGLPVVILGVGRDGPAGLRGPVADLFDLVVPDPEPVVATVEAAPQASVTLVQVLRASLFLPVPVALAAESAAYSALQSGPEFARWLKSADRPVPAPKPPAPAARAVDPSVDAPGPARARPAGACADEAVLIERSGSRLHITLHRPARHNAVDTVLREELFAGLVVACSDPSIEHILLDGAGPSFCSGGDLAEFGTLPDPATAHLIRLTRSPARLLAELASRLEVRLHGAAIGAGIEMAAFAGRVVAHPDTLIALPEIHLGLIPGAGGTVSLPRRIGRHRTAELALSGNRLEAATALRWGLIDAVEP